MGCIKDNFFNRKALCFLTEANTLPGLLIVLIKYLPEASVKTLQQKSASKRKHFIKLKLNALIFYRDL